MLSSAASTSRIYIPSYSHVTSQLKPFLSTQIRTFAAVKSKPKQKAPNPFKRKQIGDVLNSDEAALDEKLGRLYGVDRKKAAQKSQVLMDYAFVLRPYMRDYFSSIESVLHSTPNFLEENDIVASFLGFRHKYDYTKPFCITKVVEENLKANRPAYALHACRIGRESSTAGMNILLGYLCNRGKFEDIFKVHTNLNKWGVRSDTETYSILRRAGISLDSKMYKPDIGSLLTIYEDFMSKTTSPKSKIIFTNSILISLAKYSFPRNAYDFYRNIPSYGAFSRDSITYSTMLNLIYHLDNPAKFPELVRLRDIIWNEALSRVNSGEIKMTEKILNSYCNCLSLLESPEAYSRIVSLYEHYYDMEFLTLVKKEKYTFTEVQLDIVLRSALYTKSYSEALKYYENLDNMKSVKLDRSCVQNFLRNFSLVKNFNISILDKFLQKILHQESNGTAIPMDSLTMNLACRIYADSETPFDISKVEEIKDSFLTKFEIPVDDLVLSGYLSCYATAIKNSSFSPSEALKAASFVNENLDAISYVLPAQKNPLRISRALHNMINLGKYIVKNESQLNLSNPEQLDWLRSSVERCQNLQQELKKNFANHPTFDRIKNNSQIEFSIFHEKQKEILARFRRLIEYHEVHIAKASMKVVKSKLKSHAARRLERPPVPIKAHENLEI